MSWSVWSAVVRSGPLVSVLVGPVRSAYLISGRSGPGLPARKRNIPAFWSLRRHAPLTTPIGRLLE